MSASEPLDLSALTSESPHASREAAWDDFLARHSRLLLYVARSFGGDHDAAMDRYARLLEELRRDDFRRLRAFAQDGRSSFTTWLVVVAQRICADHRRSRYGRSRGKGIAATLRHVSRRNLADLAGVDVAGIEVSAGGSSALEGLEQGETRVALRGALAELTDHERLLIQLRFRDDLPLARVAGVLGYPTRFHTYRRLESILAKLRHALTRSGIDGNP